MKRLSPLSGAGANLLIASLGVTLVVIVVGLEDKAAADIADGLFGGWPTVHVVLVCLFWAFLAVAVTVATATSTNAFAVVLNGRLEEIGLRRLLGSSATRERLRLRRTGVRVGVAAVAIGGVGGGFTVAILAPQAFTSPLTLVAMTVGVSAMFTSTVVGAGRAAAEVLTAAPVAGLGAARNGESHRRHQEPPKRPVMLILGLLIVLGSVPLSLGSPFAIFVGVAGGMVLMLTARSWMENVLGAALRIADRLLPAHSPVGLAVETLRTRPAEAARAAAGVLTGTAVITSFVVALATLTDALAAEYAGTTMETAAVDSLRRVNATVGTMIFLLVVLTAVGMCSSLVHSMRQRQRGIATQRILGHSRRDARRALLAEACILTASAVIPGLTLGGVAGWAGAQDVLGTVGEIGLLPPALPWPLLAATAFGAGLLSILTARTATRAVLNQPPIRALTSS